MSDPRLDPPVSSHDHIQGRPDAPIELVEYGDFECPWCGMAYPIVKKIQRQFGDRLRFVFRHFPLKQAHPHAEHAAESAEAAAAQGGDPAFWVMHDLLYEHQREFSDALFIRLAAQAGLDGERLAADLAAGTYARRVSQDFRSGVRSGVNGTPTFFVNGRRYEWTWNDAAEFAQGIDELARDGV